MRKVLIILICLFFVNCTKKEWSRKKMIDECIQEGRERNKYDKLFTEEQIYQLCDCATDETMKKYNSEEDALRDSVGTRKIVWGCSEKILGE